jgi:hypothetical protein
MGILRNGFYTRGYKTQTEIESLTNMVQGDTVFDTTNSFRKVYDGFNWVSGNQISLQSNGIPTSPITNQKNGSLSRPSTTTDLAIASANSPTYNSNVIGCIQIIDATGVPVGNKAVLQYTNIGTAQCDTTGFRGRFAVPAATFGLTNDVVSPAPDGTLGVYMRNTTTTNELYPLFIRCVDTA